MTDNVRKLLQKLCTGPAVIGKSSHVPATKKYRNALNVTVDRWGNATIIHIKENGLAPVTYQILGSLDNTDWQTVSNSKGILQEGVVILKSSSAFIVITDPWIHLAVQVKAQNADSKGSVSIVAVRG